MKRLYTGPFSADFRRVWVERARKMQTDEWIWLLPTRHLLHTVRRQLMAGRNGLVDVPLYTFDDVADRLIQHSGRPLQSLHPYAREKIIQSLMEQHADDARLAVFRPIADQPGLYRSVAHAIGEMKRAGLTSADARNYLERNKVESGPAQRQAALAFLFLRYQEALHREGEPPKADPEERLRLACQLLERGERSPGLPFSQIHTLWVDHFTDFTPLQLRLLSALIKNAASCGIYIPFPRDKSDLLPQLSAQLEETERSLEALGLDRVSLTDMPPERALEQLREDWPPCCAKDSLMHREKAASGLSDEAGGDEPRGAASQLDETAPNENKEKPATRVPAVPPLVRRLLREDASENVKDDGRPSDPRGIALLPAFSPKREVEAVAKEIKRLVRLHGVPLHEMAIVMKDDAYEPLLHEIMQRDGVPLDAHETVGLHETALVRQLFALLSLAASDWERRDLLCLAEGGYMRWSHRPPHGLETWLKARGIDRGRANWFESCKRELAQLQLSEREAARMPADETERKRQLEALTRQRTKVERLLAWLREVGHLVDTLSAAMTWRARLEGIEQVCHVLQVEKCLRQLHAGELKRGEVRTYRRDVQAYRSLKDVLRQLKQMEHFIPRQTAHSWQGLLREIRHMAAQIKVLATPGQPGGVKLFDPAAIRGGSFAAVFVLGLNEGSFPSHHAEDWLIRDAERVAFHEGIVRLPASYAHNEMEQLFFEMAVHAAREYLVLSYVSPQADEEVLRSRFVEQLEEQVAPDGRRNPPHFKEAMESRLYAKRLANVSSPQEYRYWMMAQWGKARRASRAVAADGKAPGNTLMRGGSQPTGRMHMEHVTDKSGHETGKMPLLADLIWHAQIERERREQAPGRWDGHLLDPRIHERLRQEFSAGRTYSVSWLNDYAACPLYFFFSRVLGVQPVEDAERTLSPLDTGNILHEVLRRLFSHHEEGYICDVPLETWQHRLERTFAEVTMEWEEARTHLLSPLWPLEKGRLNRMLQGWLQHEYACQGRRRFKPRHLEFSFGLPLAENVAEASTEEALPLDLGEETLRLVGRIDRIDHDEEGHFVLYDYKLSTSRYRGCHRVEETTNFQLPLYVLAYRAYMEARGTPGRPVGAGFYSLRQQDTFEKVGLWEKESLQDLGLSKRMRAGVNDDVGEMAEIVLPRIAAMLNDIRSGRFFMRAEHEPNPFYGDRAVYRNDSLHLQQKLKALNGERGMHHA